MKTGRALGPAGAVQGGHWAPHLPGGSRLSSACFPLSSTACPFPRTAAQPPAGAYPPSSEGDSKGLGWGILGSPPACPQAHFLSGSLGPLPTSTGLGSPPPSGAQLSVGSCLQDGSLKAAWKGHPPAPPGGGPPCQHQAHRCGQRPLRPAEAPPLGPVATWPRPQPLLACLRTEPWGCLREGSRWRGHGAHLPHGLLQPAAPPASPRPGLRGRRAGAQGP